MKFFLTLIFENNFYYELRSIKKKNAQQMSEIFYEML